MGKLGDNYCKTLNITNDRISLDEIQRSIIKKYRKDIWSKFTKAVRDYNLISENDKIAVAI